MRILPFRPWIAKESVTQNLEKFTYQLQDNFPAKKTKKMFQVPGAPILLLHQIQEDDRTFRGIICLTDLRFRLAEKIYPHEATLISKERDIRKRIEINKAMLKPVLLTHQPIVRLNSLLDDLQRCEPLVQYRISGQILHTFWQIDSKREIQEICAAFDTLNHVFLADGHHRYASTLKLFEGEKQIPYLMTTYFDFDNLQILPYHRILTNALKICPDLEDRLSEVADLQATDQAVKPKSTHEMALILGQNTFSFKWKSQVLNTFKITHKNNLDTHVLNKLVFEEICGIRDSRTSSHIKYIDGRTELSEFSKRVRRSKQTAGFFLHPVSGPKFVELSMDGQKLPPKSTWFEPRILKGLIIHKF